MTTPFDKHQKKQNKEKLQKKLELRQLTLYQALQQDIAVDWFKQNNPAFLALLTPEGMKQMIGYLVIPGPEEDKMRSFKIPMIVTDILSTPTPKVFELMFTQDKQARGNATVGWLIEYFWKQEPNYIISGYVIKILNNLIPGNPHKVLEFMIKNCCPQMFMFLESHSVAEFLLRMIIVDDLLMIIFIKQRLQLFNQLIQIYIQNKHSQDILESVNYMLCQSFTRLWMMKNKQLGRFSSALLKMVEVVIDYDDKYKQEKFLPIVVKLLSEHSTISPVIIMVIYKKIFKKLGNIKGKKMKYQNKQEIQTFSSLNLHLLESIESIVNYFSVELAKFLEKENIFILLLSFVKRFEWNNIVLVEIQKIFKLALSKKDHKIYKSLVEPLIDKLKEWKDSDKQLEKSKSRGYRGLVDSLQKYLGQIYLKNESFKQFLQKSNLIPKLQRILPAVSLKQQNQGFRIVNNIARPSYKSNSDLCLQHMSFFLQTQAINKQYQQQNPADHVKHKQDNQLITQIQNENQLVYKLLIQQLIQSSPSQEGQKKMDDNNMMNNQ